MILYTTNMENIQTNSSARLLQAASALAAVAATVLYRFVCRSLRILCVFRCENYVKLKLLNDKRWLGSFNLISQN